MLDKQLKLHSSTVQHSVSHVHNSNDTKEGTGVSFFKVLSPTMVW